MYKLMLVDDQRIIMEGIVKLIQQMNLPFDQFVFAENGSRALEMLETENPDALITDIRMPVMDGLEATGNIRKLPDMRKAGVPIIAMTADAFEEDIQKCRNAGMDGYISKPIDINKMFEIIRLYYKKENEEQRT